MDINVIFLKFISGIVLGFLWVMLFVQFSPTPTYSSQSFFSSFLFRSLR